jgi:hypothetical protein
MPFTKLQIKDKVTQVHAYKKLTEELIIFFVGTLGMARGAMLNPAETNLGRVRKVLGGGGARERGSHAWVNKGGSCN